MSVAFLGTPTSLADIQDGGHVKYCINHPDRVFIPFQAQALSLLVGLEGRPPGNEAENRRSG